MDTFVTSLKDERDRLNRLIGEMESGSLETGYPLMTTPDTIRHVKKQVDYLEVQLASYEAQGLSGYSGSVRAMPSRSTSCPTRPSIRMDRSLK